MPPTLSGGFRVVQSRAVNTSTCQELFTVNFVFVHPRKSSLLTERQSKIGQFCTSLPQLILHETLLESASDYLKSE